MRTLTLAVAALSLAAGEGAAQGDATSFTPGVAYDSLRQRPLAGALVSVPGRAVSAVTDDSGRFQLPPLAPGRHSLRLEHELLDALGYAFWDVVVEVRDPATTLRVAAPGFADIWKRECGAASMPGEAGLLFGTVRDARRASAIRGATVRLVWSEVGYERASGATQEWRSGTTLTDERGRFAACGVPREERLTLRIVAGDALSDAIQIDVPSFGIVHQGVALRAAADSAIHGTVVGFARDASGSPLADAVVELLGGVEALANAEGRFLVPALPIGTRAVRVRAIGYQPVETVVDVTPGDTARLDVVLGRVTLLERVEVRATTVQMRFLAELEERKALGIAKFIDSTTLSRLVNVKSAVLSRTTAKIDPLNRLYFEYMGSRCYPTLWLDKSWIRPDDVDMELHLVSLSNVASIEVYTRGTMIPSEFWPPVASRPPCGVIVVWTKRMFP
ncbi:MAG: carboxypeptidase regulatory-like domain-containing protein [Gemmatimonadales bacterium]|nr:carboxypeptidase regulatory-like domain-containing protein [Gemmatimonadales bacterium]